MKLQPVGLFGDVLKTHQVPHLKLTETLCPPDFKARRHSHELFQFCLILEGGFSETFGQRRRECAPFTLITHPSDEAHANQYYSTGARCFVIEIEQHLLSVAREYSLKLDNSAELKGGVAVWIAKRLYQEFYRMDGASPLAIEGLVLEVMAEVSRRQFKVAEHRPPIWLKRTREMLDAQFSEGLTLNSIAAIVGTHPVHLARAFRQHYGCTVGEYVRKLRIEYACRELAETAAPISQIALAAGFYDQCHFSRTFKQVLGLTPVAYRSSLRTR